ncbi:MAG: hypothetical protein ACFE94_19460 [Candidatus Hodarchaeota archaeon]
MTPYRLKFEIEIDENQEYSINIRRADEISQYIENLHELLPDTFPNVKLRNNGNLYKLKSENRTDLLNVFTALLEVIFFSYCFRQEGINYHVKNYIIIFNIFVYYS